MALVLAAFILPFFYNVFISFHSLGTLSIGAIGQWIGLKNYLDLFKAGQLTSVLENTILWQAAVTTVVKLVIGVGLALLLQTSYIRGRKLRAVYRTMLILIWAIPPVAASALWRWILSAKYGLLDEILSMATGHASHLAPLASLSGVWPSLISLMAWNGLPFAALVLLGSLETIPRDLYEASKLDGASSRKSFIYVTLPLMRTTIAILTILMFLELFNNFVYVWITTGGGPGTASQVLATRLYSDAFVNLQLGSAAAVGVVTSVIALAVTLLFYRFVLKPAQRELSQQ